ncbi:unnamed protein product [Rhizoctonia solani]|uniref:Putative 5'-nucleotidase C-terminal domain-containing protein n=1 Tax=Rhizoctonia solani TaxID=456999 RepID=A0A8H3GYV0_9AGAM|nr:unnamed protein product [Rhizoctonia solani]
MRAILLGFLVGLASAKPVQLSRPQEPWDPKIKFPLPTRDLEWGDVNVLHTTDLHGWISGHTKDVYPEKSWSGNFGEFYSFVEHMRGRADQRHSDLLLVDTGDRRIGHGLTDHIFNTNKVNGQDASLLYIDMGYDLVVPGNHDLKNPKVVEFTMNTLIPQWDGRYLTSNVNRTDAVSIEDRKPLGARHRRWETPNGKRMMAFGVVTNKTTTPNTIEIEPINQMVKRKWVSLLIPFKEAIAPSAGHVDIFVLLGHVDPNPKKPTRGDDIKLIYDAIRKEHPLTPILIFAGHSHKRWCTMFANEDGHKRSMLLQSGRYFDTVGWMSVKLDDNKKPRDLEFRRRYLDNNLATYMFHTKKSHDFFTAKGRNITRFIERMEENEALTKIFGQLKSDYYLDRKSWTENGKNENSLFSFYLDAVEATLIDTKVSPNWLFFSNWGVLRGDIYQGTFTKSDLYAISPDDRSPFLYATVRRSVADQIVQKTRQLEKREQEKREKREQEEAEREREEEEREKERKIRDVGKRLNSRELKPIVLNANQDTYQSRFDLPPGPALSYGWVTEDNCGGDGDDVDHEKIPQVNFDDTEDGLPVYFWRRKFRTDVHENDFVDIITTNHIGKKVVFKALEELVGQNVLVKPRLSSYRDDIRQDNLLEKYIESEFPYPVPSSNNNQ